MTEAQPIIDGVLHFLKGGGKGAMSKHLKYFLSTCDKWCAFQVAKGASVKPCYDQDEPPLHVKKLLSRLIVILECVGVDIYTINQLKKEVDLIEGLHSNAGTLEDYKSALKAVIELVLDFEFKLQSKLAVGMTCLECFRLDEALLCLENNCSTAAVVMAVSAVESRLHYIVRRKNKTIYKKEFEKATLGKIASLFDEKNSNFANKKYSSIKKVLPERHQPLLGLLNTYRILSAHPKVENLPRTIAVSIINLSFEFLLDPELKISDPKLLNHSKV